MDNIIDLHIHSKYSRATSSKTDLEHLDFYSKIKGINVLGTGDFTHPKWIKEMEEKLEYCENGFYKIKNEFYSTKIEEEYFSREISKFKNTAYFIPTAEIACIFKAKERTRRLHILLIAPNLETAKKVNKKLEGIGNLHSDGRPILGLHAKDLLNICLEISEEILVIPAHVLTPWFGLYGSKSGFETIYDCFEDLTKYVYALETGLSADPEMINRIEETKKFKLISNSDAHSPDNLGREANIFEGELSFKNLLNGFKGADNKLNLRSTIEFFPEEGKYFYDGHEKCKIVFSPEETLKNNGICPICKREVTKGVLYRVNEITKNILESINVPKYHSIAPLKMIISEVLEKGETSKIVENTYKEILSYGKSEFEILVFLNDEELKANVIGVKNSQEIIQAILDVRKNNVEKIPGYDGIFGYIKIKKDKEKKDQQKFI